MPQKLFITASYCFQPIAAGELPVLQKELQEFGAPHAMLGLVLIATEGINSTVSSSKEGIQAWKEFLRVRFPTIEFKDSETQGIAFKRWSIKIKPEIVGLRKDGVDPQGKHRHLSPAEFQQVLETEDVVLLDARNDYETAIGKFKNAVDPNIQKFSEFPAFVASCGIPKDKKVLMYCTGGIRCEKALIEMEQQGYENVYQLDGGILAYLEQFPGKDYEGECYVFDHRISVDQELQPTTVYGLCPHCGRPGTEVVACSCGKEQKICTDCKAVESRNTCSKRCANLRKKSAVASA